MKTLYVLPLFALLAAGVMQQESTILLTGRITDAATGNALAGARVTVEATSVGTLTRADGTYQLRLPAELRGETRVASAELAGYATMRRAVPLDRDSIRIDFALQVQVTTVEEMSGDAASPPPMHRQESKAQLSVGAVAMPAGARTAYARDGDHIAHAPWNTESYDLIEENTFRSVGAHPLSTFSIDVDRASYSNVRRYLESGVMPPKDAVRIEELVNYFPYANAQPRGREPFAVTTEVMPAPWQPRHQLVRIALQARQLETESLPPNNLVFLLDVSGSMATPDKLPLLQQAMRMLVHELRPQDRVAIVVYAGSAGLVLESTPGSHKRRITEALDALEAGGSTAGGAGIRLAYDVARRNHIEGGNNRVILATDGDFNIGVSSDAEMVRLIEEKRAQGTFLTVLGFGTGNLKDSKMEQLADHGNGNYAYIDSPREARKVLVTEMGATLHTIAKDVKLQVEFNPERVRAYRLIGYENRLLAAEDFDDDRKDAGELGAGHTVTALYEVVPVGVEGTVDVREPGDLRYQDRPSAATTDGNELAFVKLRYKLPDGATSRLLEVPVAGQSGRRTSEDMRFAASVAGFGMLLRESEHAGTATYDGVIALARESLGEDADGYRAEFVRLVARARALSAEVAAK